VSTTPRIAACSLREAFAFQPEVFEAFWSLYGAMWMDGQVDHRTKEVVRLRNARITDCGYCKQVRFSVAREEGLDEDTAAMVEDDYEQSFLPERQKTALRFTDQFLRDPQPPGTDLVAALRRDFDPAERLELGVAAAMFMGFAKMLITLGLEPEEMPVTVVATPGSDRRSRTEGVRA
jgi:AhpD family alkylhydroperoxidase